MKQRIERSRSDGGAAIRIRNRTNFLEFLGITKTATTKKPLQVKQEAGKEEKKPLKEEKKPVKEEKKPVKDEKKPLKEEKKPLKEEKKPSKEEKKPSKEEKKPLKEEKKPVKEEKKPVKDEKKPLKEEKKPLEEEKKPSKEEKKPLKEEKKPLKEKKTEPCQPVIDDDRVVPRGARRQKQEDGHDTRMLGIRRRPIKSCFSAKALIAKSSGRGRKHHKYLRVRDIAWITAGSGRKHQRNLRARGIAGKTAGRKQRVRDSAGKTPDTAVQIDSSDDEEAEEVVNGFRFAMKSRERCQSDLQRSAKRIVYPCRTELEAIEILDSDIKNLQPSEFLNDTVIDFYIKYIQREFLSQEPDSRFHFFNSFFYKKLSGVVGKKKKAKVPDFSKLRKWTKGINIFKKDYLIIPVHDKLHWSLAIICFPNHGPGSSSRSERCILHLDSMANGHHSSTIFRVLRRYLMAEWKDTFKDTQTKGDGIMHTLTCHVYPGKKVPVPLQENESDCGLFVLYYIQKFVKSAPKTLNISDVEDRLEDLGVFGREWFSPVEASNLRISIEKLLRRLFAENVVVPDKPSNISFGIKDHKKLQR